MGWFWSNTSSQTTSLPVGEIVTSSASSSAPAPSPLQSLSQTQTSSSSNPTNVDNGIQEGDAEFQKFMAMLQGDGRSTSNEDKTEVASPQRSPAARADEKPSKLAAWKSAWSISPAQDESPSSSTGQDYVPRERSLAEAVLPVQMSCRQAFDLAWACQSPAGQWRAVYRHGGVRPCSELWDDFWFCMRVKGYTEGPLKDEAVREHYRKKEMDKYYKPNTPSSEDVWQSRTVDEVLAPGAVFQNSFQAVLRRAETSPATMATTSENVNDGREDASQILADAERRRRIRQQMGYNT